VTYPGAPEYLVVHEFEGMRIPGIGFRDVESEMGRLRAEVLNSRSRGNEEERGESGNGNKGERGNGEVKEGRKNKVAMEFTFWGLTGQYWAKGQ